MKHSTYGDRLVDALEAKNLSAYKLSVATGVPQSSISNYRKNKSIPNTITNNEIASKLNVNPIWLLTGEGEMFKESENDKSQKEESVEAIQVNYTIQNVMYVPLVSQYAYGGYLNGFADPEFIEELPKIPFAADQEHKGEYLCFEAKGDSMDDGTDQAIKERDILLCRNVKKEYWKSKLHINKWDFVIVEKDRGIVIKRIIKHDVEKGILTLHSLNDYYEDFEVHLDNVSLIFNIVDIQRKKNRR